MKKVSALKATTEEGGVSVATHNTKSKNNIVSPLYIDGSTALKTEAPLEPDQLPLSIEQTLPAPFQLHYRRRHGGGNCPLAVVTGVLVVLVLILRVCETLLYLAYSFVGVGFLLAPPLNFALKIFLNP